MTVCILTEEQFLLQQCGPLPYPSFHRGTAGMSGIGLRRAQARHEERVDKWYFGRIAARTEYHRLVTAGKLRPPTRKEVLIARAQGHFDSTARQAARRVCSKYHIKWKEEDL